jgi:hypothetical protein
MNIPRFLSFAVATLAATAAASATTRYVSASGADSGNCSSSPCRTIQYAVNQSASGDTINVSSGTYAETVSVTKQLTLIGNPNLNNNGDTHGNLGGGNATLNAAGFDKGFVISGAGSAGTVLRGFTVENAGQEGIFAVQPRISRSPATRSSTMMRTVRTARSARPPMPTIAARPSTCSP